MQSLDLWEKTEKKCILFFKYSPYLLNDPRIGFESVVQRNSENEIEQKDTKRKRLLTIYSDTETLTNIYIYTFQFFSYIRLKWAFPHHPTLI